MVMHYLLYCCMILGYASHDLNDRKITAKPVQELCRGVAHFRSQVACLGES
jgi:hypothetical protein